MKCWYCDCLIDGFRIVGLHISHQELRRQVLSTAWQAIAAESGTAASQIGLGATLMAGITPNRPWSYYASFFPLSIGMERQAKLIIQIERKLQTGTFVPQAEMKGHGHNLANLLNIVEALGLQNFGNDADLMRPADAIHGHIVEILSGFAIKGRYYHLDALGGTMLHGDAASDWFTRVVPLLRDRHYGTAAHLRREAMSVAMAASMDDIYIGRSQLVDGTQVTDPVETARHAVINDVLIPWGRMYLLQLPRWMARILNKFGYQAWEANIMDIPYLPDFFGWLNQSDREFRNRRSWRLDPLGRLA